MKKNLSDYLVAFGVLICSVVLLGALTYALTGWRHKENGRTLQVDYPDITGIRVHSELRYAGAPAGAVTGVRLLTAQERLAAPADRKGNAVRVSLRLFEGVPLLPADVKASLGSDTLLSEKFIALSAGTADAEKLGDDAILQGSGSGSIDNLVNSIGPILQSVDTALASIQPLVASTTVAVETLKTGFTDLFPRINTVADSAKSAAAAAEAVLKRADKLIADNEGSVKTDLEAVKMALTQLQLSLKRFDGFVGNTDKQVAGRMQELSSVLRNLEVATAQMKTFTRAIAEKPSRVLFSSKQPLPDDEAILRAPKPVPRERR
ncbi:MAG: Mammalian cell entry related domain protein [Chthoniobacteraceae bacterium]|nr:Mammalian cell entry related domain protein [Chthoniobacteraceae bacterium]